MSPRIPYSIPRAIPSEHRDESALSDDDDIEEIDNPVESLVSGRTKRVTAGNRLSSLLDKEGDDDLELLFAEDEEEEDVEFEGDDEEASDVQLDSSTDDENQGSARTDDELEGERELQKQNRAEKLKKRKAQEVFKRPGGSRKRTRMDPTAIFAVPKTPAARPKKKSERVSWIPRPEEGPTRSSTRKQTVQNKEVVHLRMVESEKRRLNLTTAMDAAAKRKDASKPKVMTQAERMEEADRTERRNAKSLNRWEETEKKRTEEQRAKLEALRNRQLSGPAITWWSGLTKWINGRLKRAYAKDITEGNEKEQSVANDGSGHPDGFRQPEEYQSGGARDHDDLTIDHNNTRAVVQGSSHQVTPQAAIGSDSQPVQSGPIQGPNGFLEGIYYYASLPVEPQTHRLPTQGTMLHNQYQPSSGSRGPGTSSPYAAPEPMSPVHPIIQSPAITVGQSSRNFIILRNIDADAVKLPELQDHILLKKRSGKVLSKCVLYKATFLLTN